MQECPIDLGSCSFRESREKSREKSESTVRLAGKSWKPGGGKVFVFGVLTERERLTWSSVVSCKNSGQEKGVNVYDNW